ncbi:MAG: outer membrane beta-barrel protein [Alphaproteobacteria bacterium]|nr:outer membrane beta-barrel protein [Alphaproteobacteria bacterium]
MSLFDFDIPARPTEARAGALFRAAVLGFLTGLLMIPTPVKSADSMAPESGWAGSSEGWYIEGRAGYTLPRDSDLDSATTSETADLDDEFSGAAALGYDFGQVFRAELELGYRPSDVGSVNGARASGDADVYSYMGNLIAQWDTPDWPVTPYVGVGLGAATADVDASGFPAAGAIDDDDTAFAYQAIAGLSVDLTEQLALTGTYSYFDIPDLEFNSKAGVDVDSDYSSHSFMVGLRWTFPVARQTAAEPVVEAAADAAAPFTDARPQAAQAPVAPPPVSPVREFTIFFEWDKATLTDRGRQVVEQALGAAQTGEVVTITVTGHTDRSGPRAYNQKLSERRAETVKSALVDRGFPADGIETVGKGEDAPLIATDAGAREFRNRRAVIVLE